MRLSAWGKLTETQKRHNINYYGKSINHAAISDSLRYLDAVIARTVHLKNVEKRTRYGLKAVAEHLRWCSKAEDGSVLFKVNNNLTSDINHLLLRMFPELKGFYEVRSLGGEV